MRHPSHPSLRIPAAFVALREYLLAGFDPDDGEIYEHAWRTLGGLLCGDVDTYLLEPDFDGGTRHGELGYHHQPVEIVPFARNGGDGLHYGWAVLAPELDLEDQPCVSFAPVDESACWLGDTTKQALENLLAGSVASWTAWGAADRSPVADLRWAALCAALDLHPVVGSPDITAGARSPRRLQPVVPAGWRYAASNDGVGVLAPAGAFTPEPVDVDPWDRDARVDRARRLVAAGYPASAVDVLKWTYPERADMVVLRDAYRALGRDLHVERADIWLDRHPG